MRRPASCVLLFALVVAGAGCASPRSSFYTLNSAGKTATSGADYSVSVGPVSVPATLDRPQIVVRLARTRCHRRVPPVGVPVADAIARVVAENLAAMLGTPHVTAFSRPTAGRRAVPRPDRRAPLRVRAGEAATLDAVWTVRSTKDGTTRSGRTTVREPVPDREYATLAAAHSRALGRMSADIAGRSAAGAGGRVDRNGGLSPPRPSRYSGGILAHGGRSCGERFFSQASCRSSSSSSRQRITPGHRTGRFRSGFGSANVRGMPWPDRLPARTPICDDPRSYPRMGTGDWGFGASVPGRPSARRPPRWDRTASSASPCAEFDRLEFPQSRLQGVPAAVRLFDLALHRF